MYFHLEVGIRDPSGWDLVSSALMTAHPQKGTLSESLDCLRYANRFKQEVIRERIISVDISHFAYSVLFFKGDNVLDIHVEKKSKTIKNDEFLFATKQFLKSFYSELAHVKRHLGTVKGKLYDADGNDLHICLTTSVWGDFWMAFWRVSSIGYGLMCALVVMLCLSLSNITSSAWGSVLAMVYVGFAETLLLLMVSWYRVLRRSCKLVLKDR